MECKPVAQSIPSRPGMRVYKGKRPAPVIQPKIDTVQPVKRICQSADIKNSESLISQQSSVVTERLAPQEPSANQYKEPTKEITPKQKPGPKPRKKVKKIKNITKKSECRAKLQIKSAMLDRGLEQRRLGSQKSQCQQIQPSDTDESDFDANSLPLYNPIFPKPGKKSYENTIWKERFYNQLKHYLSEHKEIMWTKWRIATTIRAVEELYYAIDLKQKKKMQRSKKYQIASKYAVLYKGNQKFLVLKPKGQHKPKQALTIRATEEYFDILYHVHLATAHGNICTMDEALKKSSYYIPSEVIKIFNNLCCTCRHKKFLSIRGLEALNHPSLSHILKATYEGKIETPKDILKNRGRFELIDMQDRPDGPFNWLLYYQDCKSKLSVLRPIMTVTTEEIALELLKIFLEIGCPLVLDSNGDCVLIEPVIDEIERYWPGCHLLQGVNKCSALSKMESLHVKLHIKKKIDECMSDCNINKWSIAIYFVQFALNSDQQLVNGVPFVIRVNKSPRPNFTSLFKTDTDLEAWLSMPKIYEDENDIEDDAVIINDDDTDKISNNKSMDKKRKKRSKVKQHVLIEELNELIETAPNPKLLDNEITRIKQELVKLEQLETVTNINIEGSNDVPENFNTEADKVLSMDRDVKLEPENINTEAEEVLTIDSDVKLKPLETVTDINIHESNHDLEHVNTESDKVVTMDSNVKLEPLETVTDINIDESNHGLEHIKTEADEVVTIFNDIHNNIVKQEPIEECNLIDQPLCEEILGT